MVGGGRLVGCGGWWAGRLWLVMVCRLVVVGGNPTSCSKSQSNSRSNTANHSQLFNVVNQSLRVFTEV